MQRPQVYTARKLRKDMSLPEVLLWQRIRGGATGVKFRRQHPVGSYVADFYCSALKPVIEIDGQGHDHGRQVVRGDRKTQFLTENGYQVLRIAAVDVLKDVDRVADAIRLMVARPLHHPSDGPPPRAGEELQ